MVDGLRPFSDTLVCHHHSEIFFYFKLLLVKCWEVVCKFRIWLPDCSMNILSALCWTEKRSAGKLHNVIHGVGVGAVILFSSRRGRGCTAYQVISIFLVSDFVIFANRSESTTTTKENHLQYKANYWSHVTD